MHLVNNSTLLRFIRKFASQSKVILDENVCNNIEHSIFKPRNHPGRIKPTTVSNPENIVKAVEYVVADHPIKSLLDDSLSFSKYLYNRLPPVEEGELKVIQKQVWNEILEESERDVPLNDLDKERFRQSVKDKVNNKLRERVYNWSPVNYNVYNSLLYLFTRFAADYAVLVRIFSEIDSREEVFKPRSFFDFGSGIGTASWAANLYWKKYIFEYFNVDSSKDMNDLARLLLQGKPNQDNPKGTFYRQFLPANNTTYDLVVCAYSLLELPSLRARLQTVLKLWNKTEKYLVIVEQGTKAGYTVIMETRDFLLNIENEANKGHIFSPCPHDFPCPKFLASDKTCCFEVYYYSLPFGKSSSIKREKYSYVVFKKGHRDANDPQWPRIVTSPLVRSKHTICRMCTSKGNLQEIIFTAAKHGKMTYHCARSTEWGDRLPINIEEVDNV